MYKKIIVGVATYVPAYMRAPGSNGSSAASVDRQAEYLTSERHREDMKSAERIQEQEIRAKNSLDDLKRRATVAGEKYKGEKQVKRGER